MRLLRNILQETIRDLGIEKSIMQHRPLVEWSFLVGDQISKVTEPQRIVKGKLFVKVKNDTWRQELQFQKKDLIQRLNDSLKEKTIKDIIFI